MIHLELEMVQEAHGPAEVCLHRKPQKTRCLQPLFLTMASIELAANIGMQLYGESALVHMSCICRQT